MTELISSRRSSSWHQLVHTCLMMTKYHLTWSSKHKAVRRVEQAAYVILMPTLTPHYASSDRASHRYFHSFIQPVWHGAFMVWQFFTRRIFASAQRFRISARAQRCRISATIGLNAYVFCVCSPPSYVAFVQRKRVLTLGYYSIRIHASTLAASIMRG